MGRPAGGAFPQQRRCSYKLFSTLIQRCTKLLCIREKKTTTATTTHFCMRCGFVHNTPHSSFWPPGHYEDVAFNRSWAKRGTQTYLCPWCSLPRPPFASWEWDLQYCTSACVARTMLSSCSAPAIHVGCCCRRVDCRDASGRQAQAVPRASASRPQMGRPGDGVLAWSVSPSPAMPGALATFAAASPASITGLQRGCSTFETTFALCCALVPLACMRCRTHAR